MICFNCGLKLQSNDVRECQLCGMKFAQKCPSCEAPNPSMAKFCFNCGAQIVKTDVQSSIQNFDTLSENRKNVAVIFADVSGFTALSEKMDPEEVRDIINDCFSYITKPVYELEGTIDKYIGDCVMILFGAKYPHSDDAKRALICAYRMMGLIRDFSEERLSKKGFSLDLSIGVNYGLVVTGSIGNYFDKDYTVMGDIVNTAQRLQSNAGRGNILVSESVYQETREAFAFSEAKEVAVKNKKDPVKCYSPLKMNVEYSVDVEMPFIGRDREMALLGTACSRALNESTKCVLISGDSGLGKTRLLNEFSSILVSEIKKIWVGCSSSSQNRIYSVMANVLMNVMNINPDDSASIKQHRLASFLDYVLNGHSDEEIKRNYDFLGLVLGLGRDHEFENILNSMSFENIKREILRQLAIFFSNLCKKYKLIIVVDDIHWADTSSMELFKELLPSLSDVNIMFAFTSRYEIEELKSLDENLYSNFKLEPLGDGGTLSLINKLLCCDNVDKTLLDAIARFTKGNPLYIREYILNLKKTGRYFVKEGMAFAGSDDISALPNSLQSIILANLSEFDDSTMGFLQAASVVGTEFNLSLVSSLFDNNFNETDILSSPIQSNVISLKSVYTSSGNVEKIYTFNQEIEREVIYDSILNKNKKELHKKIGELIEAKHSRDMESYYEILCSHFYNAGVWKKAMEYYYKAASKHKSNFNYPGSLEYYKKFLGLADLERDAEKDSRIVSAFIDVGYINFITARYDLALESLNKALDLAHLSDDRYSINILMADVYKEQGIFDKALDILDEMQPRIKQDNNIYGKLLQMKCSILRIVGNPEALSLARKSEKILLKTKDYQSLSETMKQAGIIYFTKGDVDNALFYLKKSYKYAEEVGNIEAMAKVSGNLGIIYLDTGMISKALEAFSQTIDMSRKISDPRGNITGSINLGILYLDKGLFGRAEALFKESLNISREISSKLYECASMTNLGDLMYEKGHTHKALELYNKSLDMAVNTNLSIDEGVNYIGIARLMLKQGQSEKVMEILNKAFKIFNDAGETMYLSDYYRYKSLYELSLNNYQEAMQYSDKAIELSMECKSDMKKIKALRLKGNILASREDFGKALSCLEESITLSEQLESEYETAKGYYRIFNVLSKLGRVEDARKSLIKAKAEIKKVDRCRWTQVIEQAQL